MMIFAILLRENLNSLYFSFACTIQLDEQVILTGGNYDEKRVDVYNMDGWVKGLPRLGTGRYKHGCGHYIDSNDRMVVLYGSFLSL